LIVMPARNEAERIASLVVELRELLPARVLVIDDASTDATADVAEAAGATAVRLPFHLGYGAALQTGYKYALAEGFDYVVQMDADGQHRPAAVPGLLACVTGDACDIAIGSRFTHEAAGSGGAEPLGDEYEMGRVRSLARRTLSAFAGFCGLHVSDPTSGFQAMNLRALRLFTSDWYPYDYPDVDVLLLAHRRGLRLMDHAVDMAQGSRPSTLHSGWMPVYYAYRMVLSLWALAAVPRRHANGLEPLVSRENADSKEELK
jgi:glycosyltransferase involved in cell wall biosynthesis